MTDGSISGSEAAMLYERLRQQRTSVEEVVSPRVEVNVTGEHRGLPITWPIEAHRAMDAAQTGDDLPDGYDEAVAVGEQVRADYRDVMRDADA